MLFCYACFADNSFHVSATRSFSWHTKLWMVWLHCTFLNLFPATLQRVFFDPLLSACFNDSMAPPPMEIAPSQWQRPPFGMIFLLLFDLLWTQLNILRLCSRLTYLPWIFNLFWTVFMNFVFTIEPPCHVLHWMFLWSGAGHLLKCVAVLSILL